MSLQLIEELLADTIGLNIDTLGDAAIKHAVERSMGRCKITSIEEYAKCIVTDDEKMRDLIEESVVSKTWFFREPASFGFLQKHCRELHEAMPSRTVRVLCIGCATGEEPYSMVMALHNAGIPLKHIHVDALDISVSAVKAARKGLYGHNSFKTDDLSFRERHFEQPGDAFCIDSRIKRCVTFINGNALREPIDPAIHHYGVILCRHLLIYLRDAARASLMDYIQRLLPSSGLLVVGSVEASLLRSFGFQPVKNAPPSMGGWNTPPPSTTGEIRDADEEQTFPGLAARATVAMLRRRPSQSQRAAEENRRSRASAESKVKSHCWSQMGIFGDGTCPRLAEDLHCHHCPVYINYAQTLLTRPAPEDYLQRWAEQISQPETPQPELTPSLIFRLSQSWFAVPARLTDFLAQARDVHSIPHRTDGLLRGIVNLNGRPHLCVSLHRLFGVQQQMFDGDQADTDERRMIVLRDGEQTWAFEPDEVRSMRRFDLSQDASNELTHDTPFAQFALRTLQWEDADLTFLHGEAIFAALRRGVR